MSLEFVYSLVQLCEKFCEAMQNTSPCAIYPVDQLLCLRQLLIVNYELCRDDDIR